MHHKVKIDYDIYCALLSYSTYHFDKKLNLKKNMHSLIFKS